MYMPKLCSSIALARSCLVGTTVDTKSNFSSPAPGSSVITPFTLVPILPRSANGSPFSVTFRKLSQLPVWLVSEQPDSLPLAFMSLFSCSSFTTSARSIVDERSSTYRAVGIDGSNVK